MTFDILFCAGIRNILDDQLSRSFVPDVPTKPEEGDRSNSKNNTFIKKRNTDSIESEKEHTKPPTTGNISKTSISNNESSSSPKIVNNKLITYNQKKRSTNKN
jgi:hypothetical protein